MPEQLSLFSFPRHWRFTGHQAMARELCPSSSIAGRAMPFRLPPAATGVVMAVSALLLALVRRMGLPLLCAAAFRRACFRRTGLALIALHGSRRGILLVVPVHLPLIPLLRLSGPFHSCVGLRLPRSRAFHPLIGGCLSRGIALRTPLNLCGCLP